MFNVHAKGVQRPQRMSIVMLFLSTRQHWYTVPIPPKPPQARMRYLETPVILSSSGDVFLLLQGHALGRSAISSTITARALWTRNLHKTNRGCTENQWTSVFAPHKDLQSCSALRTTAALCHLELGRPSSLPISRAFPLEIYWARIESRRATVVTFLVALLYP